MRSDVRCDSDNLDLNLYYRNGGNLVEDRENGHDCVTQMSVLRRMRYASRIVTCSRCRAALRGARQTGRRAGA